MLPENKFEKYFTCRLDVTKKGVTYVSSIQQRSTANLKTMKIQVNIFLKGTETKIGSFVTKAKNIQKAFYNHINFPKYGVCATECYYKLSDCA